jgi:hypothetical protein
MRTPAFSTFAILSTLAGAASAQPASTASTEVAAQSLFDEAMQLMKDGKIAEACPKLARSQSIAPNGGTLYNLAECYEKNGQSASA